MILYDGPSMLDGKRIICIATAGTNNRKTGDMIQTWILRADMDPIEASATESDSTVCGDCPHRRSKGGSCYVTLHQAPLGVWKAWWRGSYAPGTPGHRRVERALADGVPIRMGAYGDPVAVPVEVWKAFLARSSGGHTGYTHQWRLPVAEAFRTLVMASCDTVDDIACASASGWRYFAVLAPNEPPPLRSVECLSDARDISCADCRICNGARPDRDTQPVFVWIRAHGALVSRFETSTGRRSVALQVMQ